MSKEYDVSPIDHDFEKPILQDEKKAAKVSVRSRNSSTSSGLSIKTPRAARFAEATSVNSPIGPTAAGRSPFADPPRTQHLMPEPQPSDVGFGYVSDNVPSRHASYAGVEMPQTPASPLKSALRVPGTPGRLNPLSPTFREEEVLEKHEAKTDKENAKDLKIKTRVRLAKVALRGVNFSCSLIVVAMISTTFSIFNATRNLPPRGTATPWANQQKTWPQITLLCIACVSLAMASGILWAYFRGGHRRAEKAAVYYTVFAMGFFIFSIVMWAVGAAILNEQKKHSQDKDMWGWSCKEGKRKELYNKEVDYALVCRLQNWSLICALIEIVVEVITISIYGIVFYRFYSKRRLHKSMDLRDKARTDLYLAQLRTQSAPNTPGFKGDKSPYPFQDPHSEAENGNSHYTTNSNDDENTQFAQKHHSFSQPKPFTLQPPPIRVQNATPTPPQNGFETPPPTARKEIVNEHVPAAPGEETYAAVPIPGAYASPLASPAYPSQQVQQQRSMSFGQALTTERRVESPPASPRLGNAGLR